MPSLPTRAELAQRYSTFEREYKRRQTIASIIFLGALYANLPLLHWLERYGAEWIMVPLFVAEIAAAIASNSAAGRFARAAGVSCPSCGATFLRKEARQIAVATGTCVECAAPLADDAVGARGASIAEIVPGLELAGTGVDQTKRWILVIVLFVVVAGYGMISATSQGGLTPAVGVTVEQAAARIEASRGRPSVVLLYGTRCRPKCRVLAEFAAMARRHPDVDILAFSNDERGARALPALLRRHDATFAPVYLRHWPSGNLDRAMAPLGIHIGTTWTPHLIAVRDAEGHVVAQEQGVQDIGPYEVLLQHLLTGTAGTTSEGPR